MSGEGAQPREIGPKKAYVLHKDFVEAGYTDGCLACECLKSGAPRAGGVNHSALCRARIEAYLQSTERGRERMESAERRAVERTAEMVSRRLAARGLSP